MPNDIVNDPYATARRKRLVSEREQLRQDEFQRRREELDAIRRLGPLQASLQKQLGAMPEATDRAGLERRFAAVSALENEPTPRGTIEYSLDGGPVQKHSGDIQAYMRNQAKRAAALGVESRAAQGALQPFYEDDARKRAAEEQKAALQRALLEQMGAQTADIGAARGQAGRKLDIEEILGRGQLSLGGRKLDIEETGMERGFEERGLDRALAKEMFEKKFGLDDKQAEYAYGLAQRGLDIQSAAQKAQAELGGRALDIQGELGRGGLALGGRELDLKGELGRGQLALGGRELDVKRELGVLDIESRKEALAGQREFELKKIGSLARVAAEEGRAAARLQGLDLARQHENALTAAATPEEAEAAMFQAATTYRMLEKLGVLSPQETAAAVQELRSQAVRMGKVAEPETAYRRFVEGMGVQGRGATVAGLAGLSPLLAGVGPNR